MLSPLARVEQDMGREAYDPQSLGRVHSSHDKTFAVLSVIYYLLTKISGTDQWKRELDSLIAEFDDVPLGKLGFPLRWRECDPWMTPSQGDDESIESEQDA